MTSADDSNFLEKWTRALQKEVPPQLPVARAPLAFAYRKVTSQVHRVEVGLVFARPLSVLWVEVLGADANGGGGGAANVEVVAVVVVVLPCHALS